MENLQWFISIFSSHGREHRVMYQMKWHQQWNYASVQIKQLDIQEDTLFLSRHVEKVWRWDGVKLSWIAAHKKPNSRSIRALWLKNTWINLQIIFPNKEPTSADIRPCQELVSAIGVSVQINLYEAFTETKTFDLNESLLLRHRHRQDFPLSRDSEAIYSTKALWRSMFAVIIQLIGYEESSNAIAALLTLWTLLKTGGVFSHSDNKRSSE